MKHYDVVIVGAGIIGLSIAFQIARRSKLGVLVLEKGAAVGEGSTGASSAVCRFRYTRDNVVRLARDGIAAYQNWREYTGLSQPRARFNNDGVLWMTGNDHSWAEREHRRMQQFGISTEVLNDRDITERFPSFNSCPVPPDVETGDAHECTAGTRSLFENDGGWVDPTAAAQDLVDACREKGVDVRFKSKVDAVAMAGGKVESVTLEDGGRFGAELLVNAAGPWCDRLYEAAGCTHSWDLKPVRIQIIYRDRPEELEGHIPVTADMGSGIYFRTQNRGQQLLVGSVMEDDEREVVANPDRFQREVDDEFQYRILHILHHRLPAMPSTGRIRGYCGLYTMNRDDVHPILGPTAIDGLWAANGFSGHGFKLAPAIGSMIARAITNESSEFDTAVPLSEFSVDRTPIVVDAKSVLA
jgi:glycine/D-amino acid oxidase-like deaminating enzyme